MKDIITSISGLITLGVFIFCMFTGAEFEATLWKSLVIFVASNLIGYAAFGITSVTMQTTDPNTDEKQLDDNMDMMGAEAENEQAAMNA